SLLVGAFVSIFFFFFQAEDGIRDGHVTGVQTCALPICSGTTSRRAWRSCCSRDACGSRPAWWERLRRAWRRTRATYLTSAPATRDRKSVVEGKSVHHGGVRIIEKEMGRARFSHRSVGDV